MHRPTEPHQKDKPWLFFGKPKKETSEDHFVYEVDFDGVSHFIRIEVHQRHRKVTEEPEIMKVQKKWWDAEEEVSPTLAYSPEVAATKLDTQPEDEKMDGKPGETAGAKSSPAKKKLRTEQILQGNFENQPGPGNFPIVNLGGVGDCGWRTLAYGIAYVNSKNFTKDPEEETRIKSRICEVGAILRTQVTRSLLNREDWHVAWAKDPSATVRTEGGPVATTVAQFRDSLTREHRWICGMTLQETALVKRINVVVFEMVQGCWKRTGLIFGTQQNHHKVKTVVLVLHLGHYYSVKASTIPSAWLDPEGVKWCTLGFKASGYFARGGGALGFCTPEKAKVTNSISSGKNGLSRLIGTCSSKKSVQQLLKTASSLRSGSSTGNDKGSTSKQLLLRTASSLRSRSTESRGNSKSPMIIKDKGNKPQPQTVEIWKCSVCDWEIAGTMAGTRGKIRYHRKLHDFTGSVKLISRGPLQPIPFSKIGDSGCSFRCPWCGLGTDAKGRLLKLSKKFHASACLHKPPGKFSLWQFHMWGKFGPKHAKGQFRKAADRYAELGHKPIKCEWKVPNNKNCRHAWVCAVCNASSVSSRYALCAKCPGEVAFESQAFWVGLSDTNLKDEVMKKIDNDALCERVDLMLSKYQPDKIRGHVVRRVKILDMKKSCVRWCSVCNATNRSYNKIFYRPCTGKLAVKGLKFWQRLRMQGDDEDLLKLMKHSDQAKIRSYLQE